MTVTLNDVQAASRRLAGVALRTPLLSSRELNRRSGGDIYLKPENLQHIGAFKFRGAYNRLSQLEATQRRAGVVAYSSGNHAQGVALAAQMLEVPATIVMPADAPSVKIEGTRALGATIRLYDRDSESREAIADEIATQGGQVIVPAFDDPHIIAGQGTCGLELVEQLQEHGRRPGLVVCPVGGGGLIAGLATAVKGLVPDAQVCGVEPEAFDDHVRSLRSGRREQVARGAVSFCDALLAPSPGELTWSINRNRVDCFVAVTDRQVAEAMAFAFRYLKLVVEPGGAVALAAVLSGQLPVPKEPTVVVLSGGNVDPDLFCRCLQEY